MYWQVFRWYLVNSGPIHTVFSICANTDANTFTNMIPIHSNTDWYKLTYDQYKHQYRPVQTTSFTILAIVHYCQIRRPRQHPRTASTTCILVYMCLRGICASQAVTSAAAESLCQPNPLGRGQIVPQFFVTAKLSTLLQNLRTQIRRNDASWCTREKHLCACSTQIPEQVWRACDELRVIISTSSVQMLKVASLCYIKSQP